MSEWAAPTVEEFYTRFPAFVSVDSVVIQQALDEAGYRADTSWASEADYQLGVALYAAHVLVVDGFGTGAESQMAASGTLGVKSFKSGPFSVEYGGSGGGSVGVSPSPLSATSYGRRYLDLLKVNKPAILVV